MDTRYSITITPDVDDETLYHVEVVPQDGEAAHTYRVHVNAQYADTFAGARTSVETVLKTTFYFLLERESPPEILSEFALSDVATYFPEFPDVLLERLKPQR